MVAPRLDPADDPVASGRPAGNVGHRTVVGGAGRRAAATSTGSCRPSTSTAGSWPWPRTTSSRCWSASSSWPSSAPTWTSSSRSGWPASRTSRRPGISGHRARRPVGVRPADGDPGRGGGAVRAAPGRLPRRHPAAAGRARRPARRTGSPLTTRTAPGSRRCFVERIFPVLTPLAVDPGHPFPYISNLSLNLAVIVRDPVGGERRFARVKVPPVLPGLLAMPDGKRFVAAGAGDRRPPGGPVPGHGDREPPPVPGHPQRRPDARGGGGRRPARGGRDGAAPPAVRPGRAPRGRRRR